MTKVLILSHTTGYQLRAFNDAADALGVELVFATDRCHRLDDPWQDRAVAVRFHDIEHSVQAIVRRARDLPIEGLIAVGDRPVVLAAHAAEALGIRWHAVAGAVASTDKRRSRAALAAAGLPSPRFAIRNINDSGSKIEDSGFGIEDQGFGIADQGFGIADQGFRIEDQGFRIEDQGSGIQDPGLEFPVVLKPLGLSGSRGVIRANDAREFAAARARIAALLARPQIRAARTGLEDQILVEEYIDGREFAVEGVLTGGHLQTLAIFDKPDPLDGPFFEETIYVTPSREPAAIQAGVAEHVARAAQALALYQGPIHAECRITQAGKIYVLEVAARPIGGLCSRVLSFVRGADGSRESLESVLIRHALGQSIDHYTREPQAAAVMMIPIPRRGVYKGVSGEDRAHGIPGITEIRVTAKTDQLLEPLPEAGSYLGFIFARAPRASDAEMAVRKAFGHLRFEIARELPVSSHQ
jgi:biotin carboxylase